MAKMQKSKRFTGVYYLEAANRQHRGKPDKGWYINFRHPNTKKLIWEKVGYVSEGYTEAHASTIRGDRIRAIRHGEELPQDKQPEVTLEEFAPKYMKWSKANKKSWGHDNTIINKHLLPQFGKKTLYEICSETYKLEEFKAELLEEYAPQTVKTILAVLNKMVNTAKKWGDYIGKGLVYDNPQVRNGRLRYLTHEEAKKLLEKAKELAERKKTIMYTATYEMAFCSLCTGARHGELLGLQGHDVDLEQKLLRVSPKDTAGNKDFDYLNMPDVLVELFKEKDLTPHKFVWSSNGGTTHLNRTGINRAFNQVVEALGFNDGVDDPRHKVVFHTLRHTFASWLAIQGEALLTIKDLMRHTDIHMTMRYAHLCPDTRRKAIDRYQQSLDQLL